jgi:molybdenum cofactor cytidylyltransferase
MTFKFAAVILGAGASSRMGQPKLLLPWGRRTVLGHLVATYQQLGATQIAVVVAPASPLQGELDRLHLSPRNLIINPEPSRGLFSSIQCAAAWPRWNESLTHWLLTLGDQPHLGSTTLQPLLRAAAASPNRILQPSYLGRPKHPIVFRAHRGWRWQMPRPRPCAIFWPLNRPLSS